MSAIDDKYAQLGGAGGILGVNGDAQTEVRVYFPGVIDRRPLSHRR
jgi:hypothetical protein